MHDHSRSYYGINSLQYGCCYYVFLSDVVVDLDCDAMNVIIVRDRTAVINTTSTICIPVRVESQETVLVFLHFA